MGGGHTGKGEDILGGGYTGQGEDVWVAVIVKCISLCLLFLAVAATSSIFLFCCNGRSSAVTCPVPIYINVYARFLASSGCGQEATCLVFSRPSPVVIIENIVTGLGFSPKHICHNSPANVTGLALVQSTSVTIEKLM